MQGEFDESGATFVQLLESLKFYMRYDIDDVSGQALSSVEMTARHYEKIRQFQKICFHHFKDDLEDFALLNVGSIDNRQDLEDYLGELEESVFYSLCEALNIRTKSLEDQELDRDILMEAIVFYYEDVPKQMDSINSLALYPNEVILCIYLKKTAIFDESTLPSFNFTNTYRYGSFNNLLVWLSPN